MGHVYRERHEIARPPSTHINPADGRVYVCLNPGKPQERTVIGYATGEYTMHPNETFRLIFPEIWNQEFKEYKDCKAYEIHAGLYGLTLGVSYKDGLYKTLHDAYGPLYGNAIIDYAMYSISERLDVTRRTDAGRSHFFTSSVQ